MKALVIIIASILVIQYCRGAPAPQRGVVVEDDVELVPAENTNTRHPENGFPLSGGNGDFPVIIIRTSSRGKNPLQAILNEFFGNAREETDHNNDRVPKIPDEEIPEIPISGLPDLSTILGDLPNTGGNNEGDVASDEFFPSFPSIFQRGQNSDGERCGLLCTMLSGFDKQLKEIEEEVREIRDKQKEKENEIPQGDETENEGPVNEYTEEILPDGTMVKTNKTYHTSEDGTSYYSFQSTSVRKGYGNSDVPVARIPDVSDKQSDDSNEQEEREETTERVREEFENISTAQENKRTARSPYDPFDQQQEDVSFLLDKSFKQNWDKSFNQQQEQDISSLLNPQSNEISHNRLNVTNERAPVYHSRSFHGDTRVNDMLYAESRSGGLIRPEPDAEFVQKDTLQNSE